MIDLSSKPLLATFCAFLLSACSSGNEDANTLPAISFPASSIAFSVTGPDDSTPAAQSLTGTLSVSAVYMAALTEGSAVERVTYSLSGKIATVSVHPKSPSVLGPGLHSSRITVFGQVCADTSCSQLASGPAHYVNVSYPIPQIIREVSPYVVQEQSSGSVVIRGLGFTKFTLNGVSFGGFPASEFSVASDTQIEATHPPLAAGRYAIQLQVEGAPLPVRSDAELVVVTPPAFVATSISYPTPNPTVVKALYDPERSALLLVTSQNGGELLRFRYAGDSWSTADALPINTLHDIALSANGRFLLAITDDSVIRMDADTLATGPTWGAPLSSEVTLTGIAVANNGNAILTTTAGANTTSPLYFFDPRTGGFTTSLSLNNAAPFGSGDGSLIVIAQQDATGTTTPSLYQFSASSGSLSTTSLGMNRNSTLSVVDRFASRLALNGLAVYDGSYNQIGTLPDTTLAAAFSPDGARLYAYDSASAAVLVYDTTTMVASGATLNVIDTLAHGMDDPGSAPQIAISAAGDAVFLAGIEKVIVIPIVQQ